MSTSVAPVNNVHAPFGPQSAPASPDAAAAFEQALAFVESSQARVQGRDTAAGDRARQDTSANDNPSASTQHGGLDPHEHGLGLDADGERDAASGRADTVDAANGGVDHGARLDDWRDNPGADNKAPATVALHSLMPPWLAPGIASNVAVNSSAAASSNESTWAQLGRWMDQLLVSSASQGSRANTEARFTLSQDLFADTHATLTRTPDGWLLRLQTDDPRLRADAKHHEAALRKRFAQRGLGELVVEQVDA
jgi:hypothetical protein